MRETPVTIARIRATREQLAGRLHHTQVLSSATAARIAGAALGVRLADDRLYLKAEHLQKTGSFKPRAALARIAPVALRETRPRVRVFGVEPVGADSLHRALAAGGVPVPITPASVADGLMAPIAGRLVTKIASRYLEGVVLVEDAQILLGMRFALERLKQVLEPAGAAALGAVLAGAVPLREGERVCVIASGGNVALDRLAELLTAAPPLPAA